MSVVVVLVVLDVLVVLVVVSRQVLSWSWLRKAPQGPPLAAKGPEGGGGKEGGGE